MRKDDIGEEIHKLSKLRTLGKQGTFCKLGTHSVNYAHIIGKLNTYRDHGNHYDNGTLRQRTTR